jgi:hypothetical protein
MQQRLPLRQAEGERVPNHALQRSGAPVLGWFRDYWMFDSLSCGRAGLVVPPPRPLNAVR